MYYNIITYDKASIIMNYINFKIWFKLISRFMIR